MHLFLQFDQLDLGHHEAHEVLLSQQDQGVQGAQRYQKVQEDQSVQQHQGNQGSKKESGVTKTS